MQSYSFTLLAYTLTILCSALTVFIVGMSICRFIDWYRPCLEPASKYNTTETLESEHLSELLGARKCFYPLYNDYERQLQSHGGSLELLIADHLPILGRGIAGAALHGIIHLGYGYAARNPQ